MIRCTHEWCAWARTVAHATHAMAHCTLAHATHDVACHAAAHGKCEYLRSAVVRVTCELSCRATSVAVAKLNSAAGDLDRAQM